MPKTGRSSCNIKVVTHCSSFPASTLEEVNLSWQSFSCLGLGAVICLIINLIQPEGDVPFCEFVIDVLEEFLILII